VKRHADPLTAEELIDWANDKDLFWGYKSEPGDPVAACDDIVLSTVRQQADIIDALFSLITVDRAMVFYADSDPNEGFVISGREITPGGKNGIMGRGKTKREALESAIRYKLEMKEPEDA